MKHDWTYKQIGDVCDVLNGLWTGKKPPFVNVGVIRNTNFTKDCKLDPSNIFYTDVEVKAYSKRKLQHGDIIIEKSGGSDKQPVGRPILFNLDGEFSFSNFTSVLRITKETLLADFLHKVLTSIYYQGKTRALQSKTTGIHNLDFNKYLRFNIPVPPLEVQQQIVSELDKLSLVIEKKKEQVKQLDNLAQSIFYDMFGDPITNEKGWDVKTLGDIAYIGLGFTHTPKYVETGIPFLSVKDISSGKIVWDDIRYISEEEYLSAPKGAKPSKGDIMFCRVGTMGKPVIINTERPFCTFVSLGYLHILDYNVINTYIKYWMESYAFDVQVEANVKGLAIKNLNTGWLKTFKIQVPPLPLQQSFAEKVNAIERQKELINQSIREAQTLFDSRMEYYFGE